MTKAASLVMAVVFISGCSSKPPITHEAASYLVKVGTLNYMCVRDGNRTEEAGKHTLDLFTYALKTWDDISKSKKERMLKESLELRKHTTTLELCKVLDKFDDGVSTAKWQREQADTAANWELAGKIFKATLTSVQIATELAPVRTNCREFMGEVSCTSSKGY